MAEQKQSPKQTTQPRGKKADGTPADPIEIPVPKRGTIDKLLKRAAKSARR